MVAQWRKSQKFDRVYDSSELLLTKRNERKKLSRNKRNDADQELGLFETLNLSLVGNSDFTKAYEQVIHGGITVSLHWIGCKFLFCTTIK